jgi:SAM-dependent methyltransferase
VAENTYDSIPYPTFPRLATHPDRMAAVGLLFGMEPAPIDCCRVLEIGCGNGGNLLPRAYGFPQSRFLGIDLAEDPIAQARADIRALGLANLEVAATIRFTFAISWPTPRPTASHIWVIPPSTVCSTRAACSPGFPKIGSSANSIPISCICAPSAIPCFAAKK